MMARMLPRGIGTVGNAVCVICGRHTRESEMFPYASFAAHNPAGVGDIMKLFEQLHDDAGAFMSGVRPVCDKYKPGGAQVWITACPKHIGFLHALVELLTTRIIKFIASSRLVEEAFNKELLARTPVHVTA